MVIREQQIRALQDEAVHRFEASCVKRLRAAAPKHFEILGERGVFDAVDFGLRRAQSYGIVSERGVSTYVDITFMTCRAFDTDILFAWAQQTLTSAGYDTESARVNRLYQHAAEYVERVAGLHNQHSREALERARVLLNNRRLETYRTNDAQRDALALLNNIFPEKYAYIGVETATTLFKLADAKSTDYRLPPQRGSILLTGLMFLLGVGFDQDPLHAWADSILKDPHPSNTDERFSHLLAEALAAAEQWSA